MARGRRAVVGTTSVVTDPLAGPRFEDAVRPAIEATLAVVLRARLNRDPNQGEIDEAFVQWKRFYRRAKS